MHRNQKGPILLFLTLKWLEECSVRSSGILFLTVVGNFLLWIQISTPSGEYVYRVIQSTDDLPVGFLTKEMIAILVIPNKPGDFLSLRKRIRKWMEWLYRFFQVCIRSWDSVERSQSVRRPLRLRIWLYLSLPSTYCVINTRQLPFNQNGNNDYTDYQFPNNHHCYLIYT